MNDQVSPWTVAVVMILLVVSLAVLAFKYFGKPEDQTDMNSVSVSRSGATPAKPRINNVR